ncbi:MAG: VWA domain-containing protein [Oligoflexia bacterium]|nr:VWA domain-containing protein [Oligoflexia bacterium]MBF0366846.1 VWA domain-containing protein [Oligoflexia bacterium]
MKFANPELFWLLLLLPLLIGFYIWSFKHKRILIEKFVAPLLKDRLLLGVSLTRQRLKVVMLIVAVVLLVLSATRPKWGYHWEDVKRRGVDIMIALDLSTSMLAQDITPNRLERAKRKITDLLQLAQGDRIGLVAFAGVSFLQVPLTLDYGAVQIFLNDLDTELIPVPGTAIADAISQAVRAFDKGDKKSRVLILITDGEDHMGDPLGAAKKAEEEGVKIYTIGIGQEGGAPIPDPEHGGFKKNAQGEMILTKIDEEVLQKIALTTNGSYVRSVTGDLDLEKIYGDIHKSVEEKELKSGKQKRYEERFQWPLLIAILLLMLELIFSEKRGARLKLWPLRGSLGLVIAAACFLVSASSANASLLGGKAQDGETNYKMKKYQEALQDYTDAQIDSPKDDRIKYNMANSYYKMEQYEEASKLYESLAKSQDIKIAEKSLYNLGNTAYHQGKLKEAVDYYQEALKLDPQDEAAKHNLEFVRKEIKRRLEENQKQQQQQQQQQQNNQQCDNPSAGSEQKDQKQNEQKGEQKGEQKDQQQAQALAPTPTPALAPGPTPTPAAVAAEKKDEKREGKQANKGAMAKKEGTPSPEDVAEAMRWLSNLEENKKKYIKKQIPNSKRYQVEKDW